MKIIPTSYFAARKYIQTTASTCTKSQKQRVIEIAKFKVMSGVSAGRTIEAIKREMRKFSTQNEAA